MRVSKWGIGATLVAMTMLVGCSGPAETAAEKKPTSQSQSNEKPAEEAPAADCPELAEGATIEGAVLGTCIADTMKATAGYAAKTTTMGLESTARFNPSEKALESISPAGSLIVLDDAVYVKSATSEWQKADTASSDPMIAALSKAAENVTALDPTAAAASLNGTFTVTGKGSRLGKDVFILTGKIETQGVTADATYEVTADYIALASKSSTEVSGQKIDATMEVTEWDVKQDIVAPL